jgi:thiamine-monophosphate kinase
MMGLTEGQAIALIRSMIAERPGPGVEVGPGDDAAVFSFATNSVILTIDSMYEGIHFTLDTYNLSDVGWKAIAASVSDVAAMGGQPACCLISLALAEPPSEADIRVLMSGALEMAAQCHCPIVGGDLCRSPAGMGITVTVAGCQGPTGPVLRSEARPGDTTGVTGTLGDSAGGLYVLGAGNEMRARYGGLVEAHLRPTPKVQAGEILASCGATAMEDISDGLATDLAHICLESNTGCRLEAEAVPISEELMLLAREVGRDPLQWALSGGEDYELIFTAPPERFEEALASLTGHGIRACAIGRMTEADEGMKIVNPDGDISDLESAGYDHFL